MPGFDRFILYPTLLPVLWNQLKLKLEKHRKNEPLGNKILPTFCVCISRNANTWLSGMLRFRCNAWWCKAPGIPRQQQVLCVGNCFKHLCNTQSGTWRDAHWPYSRIIPFKSQVILSQRTFQWKELLSVSWDLSTSFWSLQFFFITSKIYKRIKLKLLNARRHINQYLTVCSNKARLARRALQVYMQLWKMDKNLCKEEESQ